MNNIVLGVMLTFACAAAAFGMTTCISAVETRQETRIMRAKIACDDVPGCPAWFANCTLHRDALGCALDVWRLYPSARGERD